MKIIGTAGHVDHGKSTLISALTGIHPDRLKEEKEREMTIELGFGSLTLPSGEEVGIVDVPGHRDFIGNMLAGIGGIDAVLLVIAADEGVMPQTKEHLDIIHLLNIQHGIIVLTKTDMIDDPEWLQLIELDIKQLVKEAGIENFPLVKVSARKGQGIDDLLRTIEHILAETPQKPDHGKPRLSVDRVFSMTGFGTIVTGTLVDGTFNVGDDVVCLPSGYKGKIRGLQNHNQKINSASPGSRTAINISGINVDQIQRGNVITKPQQYGSSKLLDATLNMVKLPEFTTKNNADVKVFLGSSEINGTLRLLGRDTINNAQEGYCQLILKEPIVAAKYDHFVLRRPSPSETIGGGQIIATDPKKRYKRADPQVIEQLKKVLKGSPSEMLTFASVGKGVLQARELFALCNLDTQAGMDALRECIQDGTIQAFTADQPLAETTYLINSAGRRELSNRILELVTEYHKTYPLRKGLPREELKSKLKVATKHMPFLLSSLEGVIDTGKYIAASDHEARFSEVENIKAQNLIRIFESDPFAPPAISECKEKTNDEIYSAMVDKGMLRPVSNDVVFLEVTYNKMVEELYRNFPMPSEFTVGQVRDLFGSSRKYILALLEYLDSSSITIRSGDARKFRVDPTKNG